MKMSFGAKGKQMEALFPFEKSVVFVFHYENE